LQEPGKIGTAHRHPHPEAAPRKRLHKVAAEKARAADHGDEAGGFCLHVISPDPGLAPTVARFTVYRRAAAGANLENDASAASAYG
jgi:hypothetical protein